MFRPAGYYSDSDEGSDFDYDFCYSNSEKKSTSHSQQYQQPVQQGPDNDELLYKAVIEGNLLEVRRIVNIDEFLLTGCMRQGWPLLLLACNEAQYDIVKFLLEEKRLDVNQAYSLRTALMAACESSRSSENVLKVVDLLLEFGAVINCKDLYGMTPLMFAIVNGHTEVVQLMLDQASLEATDNEGLTALFHAVNNRREDIVQLLLKAGAMTDIVNRRGFTPKQEAEFKGYTEIAQLFPAEKEYFNIPNKYLHYINYKDIAQGETESEMPGYHQEIGLLLFGMYSEQHLDVFAKEDYSLLQFLTVTDEELKKLGFELPFERKKILHGLLKFHRRAWSKRSMKKFPLDRKLDSYDIFELIGNVLKQLTVMQASLIYAAQMVPADEMKVKFAPQLEACEKKLNQLRETVASFSREAERIHQLTGAIKPVFHVVADHRKCSGGGRICWFSRVVKFSILSGVISFIVYRKLRN